VGPAREETNDTYEATQRLYVPGPRAVGGHIRGKGTLGRPSGGDSMACPHGQSHTSKYSRAQDHIVAAEYGLLNTGSEQGMQEIGKLLRKVGDSGGPRVPGGPMQAALIDAVTPHRVNLKGEPMLGGGLNERTSAGVPPHSTACTVGECGAGAVNYQGKLESVILAAELSSKPPRDYRAMPAHRTISPADGIPDDHGAGRRTQPTVGSPDRVGQGISGGGISNASPRADGGPPGGAITGHEERATMGPEPIKVAASPSVRAGGRPGPPQPRRLRPPGGGRAPVAGRTRAPVQAEGPRAVPIYLRNAGGCVRLVRSSTASTPSCAREVAEPAAPTAGMPQELRGAFLWPGPDRLGSRPKIPHGPGLWSPARAPGACPRPSCCHRLKLGRTSSPSHAKAPRARPEVIVQHIV